MHALSILYFGLSSYFVSTVLWLLLCQAGCTWPVNFVPGTTIKFEIMLVVQFHTAVQLDLHLKFSHWLGCVKYLQHFMMVDFTYGISLTCVPFSPWSGITIPFFANVIPYTSYSVQDGAAVSSLHLLHHVHLCQWLTAKCFCCQCLSFGQYFTATYGSCLQISA